MNELHPSYLPKSQRLSRLRNKTELSSFLSKHILNIFIIFTVTSTFYLIKITQYENYCSTKITSIHEIPEGFYKIRVESSPIIVTTTAEPIQHTTKKPKHNWDADIWGSPGDDSRLMDGPWMAFALSSPDLDKEEEYVDRNATVLDTSGVSDSSDPEKSLVISDNLICCYNDPSDTKKPKQRIGRPFIRNKEIDKYWTEYMDNENAVIKSKSEKMKIIPQLVTAASEDHFQEHIQHMGQIKKHYPNQKVVIYDLGLTSDQVEYITDKPDLYIYEVFDFWKYGWHTQTLQNFAWKILVWMETLQKYKAIQYFDSSIWFRNNGTLAKEEKIYKLNSCWLYYIKKAGHDITSHTHPTMMSYFPADWVKFMNNDIAAMYMAGAVIIYSK